MKSSRDNQLFWICLGTGTLLIAIQSVLLFGPIGVFLGIGSGASLGAVVYYLGAMIAAAFRWLRQQK